MPLIIDIPSGEYYDEEKEEFVDVKGARLKLEHSLIAISKWEAKFHKAFLVKKEKTLYEMQYYVRCMTITQNVDPLVYNFLSDENYKKIAEYIEDPMSASTINRMDKKNNKPIMEDTITSELIYYWMVAAQIPFKCETWHLNRLLKLIEIYNVKNEDPEKQKMSKSQILARNRELNEQRRKKLGTKG